MAVKMSGSVVTNDGALAMSVLTIETSKWAGGKDINTGSVATNDSALATSVLTTLTLKDVGGKYIHV